MKVDRGVPTGAAGGGRTMAYRWGMRRTVLVTGSTGGIGRALCHGLAAAGHRVIAAGRRADALVALRRELGVDVVELDVTDDHSIASARAEVLERTDGRGVDHLVHAAGIAELGPLMLVTDAALRRHMDTNVFGALAVTRAFLPEMRARGEGRVVAVSSVTDRVTLATHGAYGASMHALRGMSDSLRQELRPFGVDVVLVEPGSVRTPFVRSAFSGLEAKRWSGSRWNPVIDRLQKLERTVERLAVPPERVAATILRALETPRPRERYLVPTAAAAVQLAAAKVLPTRAFDSVVRRTLGLAAGEAPSALPSHPHALVTGAAGGIGRETCLRLAERGFRVVATDIDTDGLAALAREADAAGHPLETLELDITDARQLARARLEVRDRTGGEGLDLLVNNAGFAQIGPLESIDREAFARQFEINVIGLMRVTRAFAARMADRRRGRIINLSSVAGVFSFPLMGAYHASKFAVEALSDALRQELGPFGVDVVVVRPTFIRSGFADAAKRTLAPLDIPEAWRPVVDDVDVMIETLARVGGTPAEVADVILRAACEARPRPHYAAPPFAELFARSLPHVPGRLTDPVLRRIAHLDRVQASAPDPRVRAEPARATR